MLSFCVSIAIYFAVFLHGVRSDDDPTCTGNTGDAINYTDPGGYEYQILCASEPSGNALTTLYMTGIPTSLAACAKICSDWTTGGAELPCQGFTFRGSRTCVLYNGVVGLQGGLYPSAYVTKNPQPPPAAPISFNASCNDTTGAGSFQHYIDPEGFTYYTLCGKGNSQRNYASVLQSFQFSPPDITGCIRACSLSYEEEVGGASPACTGIAFDPVAVTCSIDTTALSSVSDSEGENSAYILTPNQACSYTVGQSNYSTPEGTNFTIRSLDTLDTSSLLVSNTQATACGCAEQCSLYNLAYPNATQCIGTQFDQQRDIEPNCYIRSD